MLILGLAAASPYPVLMTEHVLSFPPALEQWVEARLAAGDYADVSDYVRDLIRRDQSNAAEDRAWLKAMIDEGLASGVSDQDPFELIDTLSKDLRSKRD